MRARRLQRPNRDEGPFVLAGKHKVSQGYSHADLPIHAKSGREWGPENAGLAYAFRDDDIMKAGKSQTDPLPKFSTVGGVLKITQLPNYPITKSCRSIWLLSLLPAPASPV